MSTIKSSAENLTLNADGANNDIKFQSNGSEVASIDQAGVLAAGGATLTGNITHAGDLTLDVGGDISLDADGGDILLKDGGTTFGTLSNDGGYFDIKSTTSNQDISIKGNDGGSTVTAVRFDMSDAGKAIFNNGVAIGGTGAANTLDDYEEGNWSSVARLGGNGGADNVNSTAHAKYTKIGNVVHINVSISMLNSISGSGHLVITGLPFAVANSSQLSCRFNDNMNSSDVVAQATGSAIHFYTQSTSTTGSLGNFTSSGIHSSAASKHVNVSGTYNTDA